MITFEPATSRPRERHLKVKLTTTIGNLGRDRTTLITVTIGRIERSPDGMFRYFEPEANQLNLTLVDKSLNMLKKRIKARSRR